MKFSVAILVLSIVFSGCSTPRPRANLQESSAESNTTQVQRGMQIWPVDILTNILALPVKLMLWNWNYSNHHITSETESQVRNFLSDNQLETVRVRLNAYDPIDDFRRLFTNHEVALPLRLIDVPFVLINPFLGRFIGGIITSDFYDPFSNTVYIYSDVPSIALHELGHAKDFESKDYKGLYAASRLLPFIALFQEQEATDNAIHYYQNKGMTEDEIRAYKVLYPAYFSYIGGNLPVYPIGYVTAIFYGHFYGRSIANERARLYRDVRLHDEKLGVAGSARA